MNKNTILVVMPVYNAEETIAAAIESILNQTYKNFILVIVDDCSTDKSYEIASSYKYDRRVVVKRNQKNMGAYYSRNIGLYYYRNNTWGYFTTHDADDISYDHRFSTLVRLMQSKRLVAIQDMFERRDLKTNKLINVTLTMAHAMFTREIFDRVGYFELVRFGADWEYWRRVNLYNEYANKRSMSYKSIVGESYVHDKNLTVQIPIGSEPRKQYIEQSMKKHSKIKKVEDCYIEFNPKAKIAATKQIEAIERAKQLSIRKKKGKLSVCVVLLTWKRISNLKQTLISLSKQTYKDFSIHITNGNLSAAGQIDRYVKAFKQKYQIDISISHDGNDIYAFRRFTVGKMLAEQGVDVILFIDDDISFSETYVEQLIKQYKPKTYGSGFAWSFQDGGSDYYGKRTRHWNNDHKIHYCGTGVSIIDASIFLDEGLLKAPKEAYKIEDVWLSYYAQQVKKWNLRYVKLEGVEIGGADNVALYKEIQVDKHNKADFLKMLVNDYGWKL